MSPRHDDEDEHNGKPAKNTEFECPECCAHNPVHDGFASGDYVVCYYCGVEFHVVEFDGKLKFKPV